MSSKRAMRRRERQKSCVGKLAHATQTQAVAHMIHLKRCGEDVVTYPCPFCCFWHVGHRKRH